MLGPNGSGKTTLLRILAGYEWPSDGDVAVLGERYGACDMRAVRARIGLVSQALERLVPHAETARDVVLSGLDASLGLYRTFSRDEHHAATSALAAVNASALSSRRFEHLSQGERQRVLIARALVRRPALLILDEAAGGLDPVARERFLADVTVLASMPMAPSVLFVTHHPEEIPEFVTHALLLRAGRVVASGPIEEVLCDANASAAYGAPCAVTRERGRFVFRVAL